jgi:hypothetical protein
LGSTFGCADPARGFRDRVIADADHRGQVLLERPRQAVMLIGIVLLLEVEQL